MTSGADLYSIYDTDPMPIVEFLAWLADSYERNDPLAALDIGCGPGRLLGPLTQLGWQVVGMEPDDEFRSAAELAATATEDADVIPGARMRCDHAESFSLTSRTSIGF